MKKEEINIRGLYKIEKKDLKNCAETAAQAFINDESSKFLLSNKLSFENLYDFYLVLYRALFKKMYLFAESKDINGFIIITPVKNSILSVWDFIKAGGLKIIFNQGLGILFRALAYENNCINIRKKFIPSNAWYIFQFAVLPAKQGTGIGSKTIKPVLKWLKTNETSCYLETLNKTNIDIYKHLGFELKSVDTLPKSEKKQFAMLLN